MSADSLFAAEKRIALIELRRELHRHPELSWKEHRTAERLETALRALNIAEIQRVAGTGIVARVPGTDRKAPVTAIISSNSLTAGSAFCRCRVPMAPEIAAHVSGRGGRRPRPPPPQKFVAPTRGRSHPHPN